MTSKWEFRARFRRNAFGWKSQPAIKRIKEAVSEIRKVGRTDAILAADGAVMFLEEFSPALESVDSSSGAIGTAVHTAIVALVPIIAAERNADLLKLLEAESSRSPWASDHDIDRLCEEILLSSGLTEEAYRRYVLQANRAGTYLAWFRAVARKYPRKEAAEILDDLVASTPGEEGKWFAAAKSAKLFEEAIALAKRTPCSPQTLTRAARDFAEKNPPFAIEAGVAALHWLVQGYGYEITSVDVHAAYDHTMKAAENAACADEVQQRIRDLVAGETFGERFVTRVLGRQLGLS